MADLQVALEAEDGRHTVVMYTAPVSHLVGSLQRGVMLTDALVEWQNFSSRLIELHERYWDRMTVVVLPETLQELEILGHRISESTGISLSGVSELGQTMPVAERDESESGLRLVAMHLLALDRPRKIFNQLEALTLPTREAPYVPDVLAEFLDSRASLLDASSETKDLRKKLREQRAELISVQKENSIVVKQLHRTQEELERRILANRELQEKLRGLRRGRDYRKGKILELEKQLDEKQAKNDWLRTVRDEHRDRARQLRAERRQLDLKVQKLEAERNRILDSRSWKYTKLFRKAGAIGSQG
ncbi:MAG: hypothetical protein ACQEXN_05635 [Actinomycetota bacterium]